MKTKKILILILVSFILTTSCKKFVEGVNDDPNSFSDSPATLIIGQAQLATAYASESQPSRLAGILTDQYTGSDRQYITLERYGLTAGDFDRTWSYMYTRGAAQAKLARDKAIEEGIPQLEGVADIFYGYFLAETAILFGDVPDSEAFQAPEINNPHYDDQIDVINHAISLIDDGLQKVQADKSFNFAYVDNDFNWIEVAHSLKARYYLAIKDYAHALTEAQAGISSANGDLLITHDNVTGKKNLYYQFVVEQRGGYMTVAGSGPFAGQGSTLKRWLFNGRPSGLVTPGDTSRASSFIDGDELNTNAGGYFAADASYPVISWIETKLIEAEAAQRTGGDALTPFNEVRGYFNTLYGGFPDSTSSGSQLLQEILEEKYLSLPGSLAVYQDIRRTDNLIGVTIKGTGHTMIPQRFLYPQSEINSNSNFPGLVDLYTKTDINL